MKKKTLREGLEEGTITKEEHDKQQQSIDKKEKETKPKPEEPKEEPTMSSAKMLFIGVGILVILFASFFAYNYFKPEDRLLTIDELHSLNYEGKLDPEEGFLYKDAISFVKVEDSWYLLLASESRQTVYNLAFRYSPLEVEDIKLQGFLDVSKFDRATSYFVTFNPEGVNHSMTALAISDFNQHMLQSFQKTPKPACDRNATSACEHQPIITCDNTDEVVLYVEEAEELALMFKENCIHITGNGFDLVRAVDRLLYNLYGVMDR